MPNRSDILKQQFNQSIGFPWQKTLPESRIKEILAEEKVQYRNCIYSPLVTLWAMMAQVLDPDKSLSNAVKRIIAWVAAAGGEVPSPDTGAYSIALRRYVRTLLKCSINTIAEAIKLIPPLLHPILEYEPPIFNLVEVWRIGR